MPKKVRNTRQKKEEMSSAAQTVYTLTSPAGPINPMLRIFRTIGIGTIPIQPTAEWKKIKSPYARGYALGYALTNLRLLPGGSKQRPWTMLHAISRGRITPEQAYEIAHRRYERWTRR